MILLGDPQDIPSMILTSRFLIFYRMDLDNIESLKIKAVLCTGDLVTE